MSQHNPLIPQNQSPSLTTQGWRRISPPRADLWITWRDVAPTTTLTGRVIGFHKDKFEQSVAFIQNEAGVCGVPLPVVLGALFEKGDVREGTLIVIEYRGKRSGPRGAYHDFDLAIKEEVNQCCKT